MVWMQWILEGIATIWLLTAASLLFCFVLFIAGGGNIIEIIVVIVMIFILAGGGYWMYTNAGKMDKAIARDAKKWNNS